MLLIHLFHEGALSTHIHINAPMTPWTLHGAVELRLTSTNLCFAHSFICLQVDWYPILEASPIIVAFSRDLFLNKHVFIYFLRFSQQFIDVRENERKRSQRGVVSVPPKYTKLDEDKMTLNETNSNNGSTPITSRPDNTPSGFKPEHLLELQEKITKEILSTKLGENEMHELQVKKIQFCQL